MLLIVVLEKTLESPLDHKEIKPVNLKEINYEYWVEGLMLKLKLKLNTVATCTGIDWRQKEKGAAEDEMVR